VPSQAVAELFIDMLQTSAAPTVHIPTTNTGVEEPLPAIMRELRELPSVKPYLFTDVELTMFKACVSALSATTDIHHNLRALRSSDSLVASLTERAGASGSRVVLVNARAISVGDAVWLPSDFVLAAAVEASASANALAAVSRCHCGACACD
jgi:hypothetical protein